MPSLEPSVPAEPTLQTGTSGSRLSPVTRGPCCRHQAAWHEQDTSHIGMHLSDIQVPRHCQHPSWSCWPTGTEDSPSVISSAFSPMGLYVSLLPPAASCLFLGFLLHEERHRGLRVPVICPKALMTESGLGHSAAPHGVGGDLGSRETIK